MRLSVAEPERPWPIKDCDSAVDILLLPFFSKLGREEEDAPVSFLDLEANVIGIAFAMGGVGPELEAETALIVRDTLDPVVDESSRLRLPPALAGAKLLPSPSVPIPPSLLNHSIAPLIALTHLCASTGWLAFIYHFCTGPREGVECTSKRVLSDEELLIRAVFIEIEPREATVSSSWWR
jgi:hypothetical protein